MVTQQICVVRSLVWTPGHYRVEGNKKADRLTKMSGLNYEKRLQRTLIKLGAKYRRLFIV